MDRTSTLPEGIVTPGESLATEAKQNDIIAAIGAIPAFGGDVNLAEIAGTATAVGSGNLSAGVQRVGIATDDVNVAAINTATASLNAIIGSFDLPSGLRPVAFDSFTSAAVSSVTGANQSVISAPGANKQIWVYGWVIVGTVAGTFAFQDEDDVAKTGPMTVAVASGSGPQRENLLTPIFKVATNKALEVDVVTTTINGVISYAIVSV